MTTVRPFTNAQIEKLARLLGECGTGSEISRVLQERGLVDRSRESTKWRRLYWVFQHYQNEYKCANHVLDFTRAFLAPARFIDRSEEFENYRQHLNQILLFSGLEFGPDGQFRQVNAVTTLEEAEKRVQTIRAKLKGRSVHPEVLKYCRAELMQDNYFHAVFEATKGLAQRIRDMTGVQLDGAALIDHVFAIDRPLLALNSLRTESEKSEHKGFALLLKGCFGAIRNPRAHEPKILWKGEDDAVDYLTLLSLLHRKLDDAVLVREGGQP
ncbi:TIGR02391 family protein [Desulforudis sp. 1088]|uniref:TIGR02391 family protein n=1 Tax=unclassified Candidatus Desulforudis TaxID=2635950 RepID=UPI003CE531EF